VKSKLDDSAELDQANGERAPIDILVANRLRSLRTEKKLTLQELAAQTGIAASFLSRVENYKASPPLAGLAKLAQALGVQVESLVQSDATPQLIVMTRSHQRAVATSPDRAGYEYQLLARAMRAKLMEPFVVQLKPGPRPKIGTHAGEEFIYVLKGESVLVYGKDEIPMKAGDSVYYNATVPHVSFATGRAICELLVVISSRDYLYHGDLERLLGKLRHSGERNDSKS
jgi:transcriptional regulator with XRE-family HTH domain